MLINYVTSRENQWSRDKRIKVVNYGWIFDLLVHFYRVVCWFYLLDILTFVELYVNGPLGVRVVRAIQYISPVHVLYLLFNVKGRPGWNFVVANIDLKYVFYGA